MPGEAARRGESVHHRVPWLRLLEQSVQMRSNDWRVSRDTAFGSSLHLEEGQVFREYT